VRRGGLPSRGVAAGRHAPGDLNANKDAISGTPVREEDWGLDMTGNWSDYTEKTSGSTDLDQDRDHNEVNEITDVTETVGTAWATPVHDKAGNMTTVPKPSSPANGLTLKYDAWNRLVEVKDGATVVGKYEYDGLTRRVKRHLDSDSPGSPDGIDTYVHYFYNAAWQVLETRDTTTESDQPENLQPDYQYVWSGRYIDAPILRDENTDQDSLCDDARLYYLTDANFNVTTLTDTSGHAVERYVYDPYGSVTIYDATWSNTRGTSSYDNTVLYTGREFDVESGLYYYCHRYYSAEIGRFSSRDPIGYIPSANLYEYVFDSPTNSDDPSGLQAWPGHGWPPANPPGARPAPRPIPPPIPTDGRLGPIGSVIGTVYAGFAGIGRILTYPGRLIPPVRRRLEESDSALQEMYDLSNIGDTGWQTMSEWGSGGAAVLMSVGLARPAALPFGGRAAAIRQINQQRALVNEYRDLGLGAEACKAAHYLELLEARIARYYPDLFH